MNYIVGKPEKAKLETNTLSEYLQIVENWLNEWNIGDNAIYRGHKDHNWILVARLFRNPNAKAVIISPDNETEVEGQLLSANMPMQEAHKIERKLLDEFSRYLYAYRPDLVSTVPEGNSRAMQEWRQLALAQHYGLPTRFLDFTTNMLVALFFAVEGKTEYRKTNDNPYQEQDSAVWGIEIPKQNRVKVWEIKQKDDRSKGNIWMTPGEFADLGEKPQIRDFIDRAFIPEHFDKRILAQGSVFMCEPRGKVPDDTLHVRLRDKVITSQDLDASKNKPTRSLKIRIPHNFRKLLLEELDRVGINRATLFPDLGSAAAYLDWAVFQS